MKANKYILQEKRGLVKVLSKKGLNQTEISKRLVVTRKFVRKWIGVEDVTCDGRGWPKGKLRKRTNDEVNFIINIRNSFQKKNVFFFGPDAVIYEYQLLYPNRPLPPRSFVKQVIKDNCKLEKRNKRSKGGSRYQHYPETSLKNLGKVIEEIDFIGPRSLKKNFRVVHLFSRAYNQPFKLGMASLIKACSSQEAVRCLVEDWKKYPMPDVLKFDNDFAFLNNCRFNPWVSPFVCWLLNLNIAPVFIAFQKPWNNGSVEGFNSIFQKKVWSKLEFDSEKSLIPVLASFNQQYQNFKKQKWQDVKTKHLSKNYSIPNLKQVKLDPHLKSPCVYFIRKAYLKENRATISILTRKVEIDKMYAKQFVLVKLNLKTQQLTISYETDDSKLIVVKKQKFLVKYH